jgi:hypothetical protein
LFVGQKQRPRIRLEKPLYLAQDRSQDRLKIEGGSQGAGDLVKDEKVRLGLPGFVS